MKYEFVYLERPECNSYTMLNDGSRGVDHGDGTYEGSKVQGIHYCDIEKVPDRYSDTLTSPEWEGPAWYRFTMPAGTRIPESPPGLNHCGTYVTGWLSVVHPTSPGAFNNNAKFCFDDGSSNDCKYSTQGKVTNCGSYFVYYLENAPACRFRYCATN